MRWRACGCRAHDCSPPRTRSMLPGEVVGATRSRLFSRPVARQVTAIGRHVGRGTRACRSCQGGQRLKMTSGEGGPTLPQSLARCQESPHLENGRPNDYTEIITVRSDVESPHQSSKHSFRRPSQAQSVLPPCIFNTGARHVFSRGLHGTPSGLIAAKYHHAKDLAHDRAVRRQMPIANGAPSFVSTISPCSRAGPRKLRYRELTARQWLQACTSPETGHPCGQSTWHCLWRASDSMPEDVPS